LIVLAKLIAASCAALSAAACAQVEQPPLPPAPPCVEDAAKFHQVSPLLLRAIVFHESRNDPSLALRNTDGSIDYGLGGINSVHLAELAKFGVTPAHLLDGCTNVYIAAWHLSKQIRRYGNSWRAVGSYHSVTPAKRDLYASKIYEVLRRWRAVPAE
jgi:soluble lytic murein transglycosylase-like protein